MRIRGLIMGAMILGAVLLVSAAAVASQKTSARVYKPFTSNGAPAIHVTKTGKGYCWTDSIATNRVDAWRCFFGRNSIYDPCFSSRAAHGIVLCPTAWWKRSGIEIRLTRPLPKPFGKLRHPSTRLRPWAIETFSGLKCQANTGTGEEKDGLFSTYFCIHSQENLWGTVSRRHQPWTIYVAPFTANKLTKKAKVRVAWS